MSDPIERSPFSTNYADSTPEQKARRRRDLKAASARASRAKWTPEQRAAEAARVARRRDRPDVRADEAGARHARYFATPGTVPRGAAKVGGERFAGIPHDTVESERMWRDDFLAPQIKQAQDSIQLRSWGYFESIAYKPTSLVAVKERVEAFMRELRKDDFDDSPAGIELNEGAEARVARIKLETGANYPRGRAATKKNDNELTRYILDSRAETRLRSRSGGSSLSQFSINPRSRRPSPSLSVRELSASHETRLERIHQRAIRLAKRGTYYPPRGG